MANSYYGIPPIRAPHWRWYIINYFFLGALAGGGFAIAALAELFGRDERDESIARAARYLSIAALVPSPPLLILDLGRPERFYNMLRVLKLRSPMSLGSWALAFLGAFASLAAGMQLLRDFWGTDIPQGYRRIVAWLGLPFALFISGYTGVLLAATNVPLWARNYLLIGPTFVASAFSSSLAAISLLLDAPGEENETTSRRLARAESICLGTELTLLMAGMVRLGRLGRPLTAGRWGRVFWPVTFGGGIVAPLVLQLSGPARGKKSSPARRQATALLVLVGSYSLRALMIFAGKESANRPEDYFEYTRGR